jgi:hypothetical protein
VKFKQYLQEQSEAGWGITWVDVDETVFNTFAEIKVVKNGKVISKLNNQEFNSYTLKDDESFDFGEFRDAELFNKTSLPIPQTINRIKKMLSRIRETGSKSKIIFLTARSDFDDKKTFLKTFEQHGISMDTKHVYVERTGNLKTGTVESKKKVVMLKYLKEGIYRRARLIDDHKPNLKALLEIRDHLPKDIEDKVRKIYNLSEDEVPIKFWALWASPSGKLQEMK